MHYLVVAKVKDYPDFNELINALEHIDPAKDDYWGNWEEIAANVEEFSKSNKDEIMENFDDEDMSFEDKVEAYIDLRGFRIGYDGKVYEKVSAHFDYCILGGRYITNDISSVTTYRKVCEEYGDAGAFVLPKYYMLYTDEGRCPFEPEDIVYVIDGHN